MGKRRGKVKHGHRFSLPRIAARRGIKLRWSALSGGQKIWLILCMSFFAGVVGGSIYANISLHIGVEQRLLTYMAGFEAAGINRLNILINACVGYGKYIAAAWIFAFIPVGAIFTLVLVFVKGAEYGFTSAMLIRCFGLNGIFYGGVLYLLQSLVFIPVFFYIAFSGIGYIMKNAEADKQPAYIYLITLVIGIAAVAALSMYEAYAAPAIFITALYGGT